MVMLNTLDGASKKQAVIRMTLTATLVVGGENDEDRKDAIRLMVDDHKYEIAKSPVEWFKDGMMSFSLDDVKLLGAGDALAGDDWDWDEYEEECGEAGYGD